MKHLFLLTIGLFSTLILNAKVYTVSNVPNSVANFTSIWYAQDSASAGDTIYVAPSNSSYGDLHLNKPLVWIGGGTKPEGGVGAKTTVGYFVPESTCSGTEIYGFHFTGGAAPNNQSIIHNSWAVNGNVENIIISGCLFAAPIALSRTGTAYSNWVLKNNVFAVSSISCALALNWVVSNNIFVQVNPALSATNSSNTNNIFSNNIIISSNGTGLSSIKNFTIINNIIYGGQDQTSKIENCTVSNNLFQGNYTLAGAIGSTSIGANNIFNSTASVFQDASHSLFTSSTSAINYFRNFSPSAPFINLHLVSGSPAIGSGANGTDMGIYGGSFPWRDNPLGGGFSYFPGPGLPEIYTIINPVIATPNSTIQIRVKARNVY